MTIGTGKICLLACQIAVHICSVLLNACLLSSCANLTRTRCSLLLSSLQTKLCARQAILALQGLISHVGLLLQLSILHIGVVTNLLICQSRLHGRTLVHALRLQSVCCILDVGLLLT